MSKLNIRLTRGGVTIKDYKDKELKYYIIFVITLFLLMHGFITFDNYSRITSVEVFLLVKDMLVIISATLLSVIIDACIDSRVKDKILFICSKGMPGENIFSEIKKGLDDKRFPVEKAREKYKAIIRGIPDDEHERMRYENYNWYQIYDGLRSEPMIIESERIYLLLRDVSIYSIIIILIYLIISVATRWITINPYYLIVLLFIFVITYFGAKKKANEFVVNVIAVDIPRSERDKNV